MYVILMEHHLSKEDRVNSWVAERPTKSHVRVCKIWKLTFAFRSQIFKILRIPQKIAGIQLFCVQNAEFLMIF